MKSCVMILLARKIRVHGHYNNYSKSNKVSRAVLHSVIIDSMQAGNVYICDMKFMDGLKPRENYVNVAPICLLYVNKSKQLVPIAIQLKQGVREEEKTDNPIFLPIDAPNDWLLAKIYYQSAHSQVRNAHIWC